LKKEQDLLAEYRKSGDLRLLGKLYEPYMPLLYGVCFRYYQDHARSEDAVMQIFESLITKLRQHRVTHFKSWLYTFARNHCLMDLRKDKRMTVVDIDEHLAAGVHGGAPDGYEMSVADPDRVMEESVAVQFERNMERMEACLEQLSEEQRVCVKMFYLDQRCYQDIADEMSYTPNQVKSYIQNGKRNLRICMERKEHGQ